MTRDEAINICRQRALAAGQRGDHEYLPKTQEEAATWQPHEWVIEAVMDGGTSAGFYRQPGQ